MITPAARILRASREGERGFTLLELLVASVAGLFVVFAAFLLSRGATRVFATEGRLATSQGNLRLGVDRLRSDIERAGFMSTANYRQDPNVVPVGSMGFTARIQSLFYVQGTAATAAIDAPQSSAQGLYPDRLTIQGNFGTTDSYQVAAIEPSAGGGGVDITLQVAVGSTARLLSTGETGGSPASVMQATFAAGRLLRLRNDLGCSQYLLIQTATIAAGGRPVITTTAAPGVAQRTALSDKRCGLQGIGLGYEVNPVHTIEYGVYSLSSNALFKWAYSDASVGEANKYDLVRRELDQNGLPIAGTEEIISEYAVDLGFAFTVDTSVAQSATVQTPPAIVPFDFGDANNATYGGDTVTGGSAMRPQRIRSVRYRLAVRTRDYDRSVSIDDGGIGLLRYQLGVGQFSRARTVMGEVSLINQQGVRW